MDENTQAKFDEKLSALLAIAKKKKNVLEYQEITDYFADMANKGASPSDLLRIVCELREEKGMIKK